MESLESKLFSKSWKPVGGLLDVPRLVGYYDALEILKEAQKLVNVDQRVMLNFAEVKELLEEIEKLLEYLNKLAIIPEIEFETYANNFMNTANRIMELKSKISA